jgi:nitrile hydratase
MTAQFKPTPEHRKQVESLAGFGIIEPEIARFLGIDPKTLRKYFADELATGHLTAPAQPVARVLQSTNVDAALARGTATERAAATPARFVVGQRVRAVNRHPAGHTRLPRYVRGRMGTVERVHGVHVFADRHAASASGPTFDEAPQWLYAVAFDGQDLWGTDAEPGLRVSVDAWESYLEPVEPAVP